ncbi:MAG: hypothetical protein Q7T55_26125 [Solirubrobacteraceae bacterium]|nr:hypothetical protein [Solirubrobacteraceae bacterium]
MTVDEEEAEVFTPEPQTFVLSGSGDWYRALYNLAALQTNQAAARLAHDDEDGRKDARALLRKAERNARSLIRAGLSEIAPLKNRLTRERRDFRAFLEGTVIPSSVILLAGVLAIQDDASTYSRDEVAHRGVPRPFSDRQLAEALESERSPWAADLIAYVEHQIERETQARIAASVFYNLACLYATHHQAAHEQGQKSTLKLQALEALRIYTWRAGPSEAATQLRWAQDDPTLASLRQYPQFKAVIAPFLSSEQAEAALPVFPSKRQPMPKSSRKSRNRWS